MLKLEKISNINGCPRYYISCDEKIVIKEKIHSKLVQRDTHELFCENTNVDGLYHFGCKQLVASYDHGPGYVWSSRAGCINGQFGMKLYDECIINGVFGWHLDMNTLKSLVEEFTGKEYDIQQHIIPWDRKDDEPTYRLVEKEN